MRGKKRKVRFKVEQCQLVRYVRREDGRGHTQRATLEALKEVAWAIEERAKQGVTTGELWQALPEVPCTQISVVLDFLKARGCVDVRGRRNYLTSSAMFEDAMVEFHALEEDQA